MARILDTFPLSRGDMQAAWDEWLDGRVYELKRGEDFTMKCSSLRPSLYTQAKLRGCTARFKKIDDDTVVIQAIRNGEVT